MRAAMAFFAISVSACMASPVSRYARRRPMSIRVRRTTGHSLDLQGMIDRHDWLHGPIALDLLK